MWFVALCHGAGSAVAWVEGGNNNFPTKYNYLHRHSVLEDSNGDLWLFGGNAGCEYPVNELWKMNVRNNYTWTQITTTYGPGPRADIFSWIDSKDNLYFFGGRSSCNDSSAELWMFNTSSLTWTMLQQNGTLNRGTIGVGTSTTHPGPRVGHGNWIVNDELWLYGGGLAGLGTVYNDVWKYSLQTQLWTCVLNRGSYEITGTFKSQPSFRTLATTDLAGNTWIVDLAVEGRFVFSRFNAATLEWSVLGNHTDSVFGQMGVFSADNHPHSIQLGNLVYAGNGILAFTTVSETEVVRHWHYNITTNEWAFMYGPTTNDIPTIHYGTFQQIDSTNVIGTRQHFGQSLTKGNSWIVRGHTVNDTWLFPVSRCGTDIDPCDSNAECSDHLGWTDCKCNDGYEGNGYKCTQIPPISPSSSTPPSTVEPQSSPVSDDTEPLAESPIASETSPNEPLDGKSSPQSSAVVSKATVFEREMVSLLGAIILAIVIRLQ